MSESGRSCRPSDRRATAEAEPFTVKLAGDGVAIELRGRLVRTVVGPAGDELRRAIEANDDDAVQRLAARRARRPL